MYGKVFSNMQYLPEKKSYYVPKMKCLKIQHSFIRHGTHVAIRHVLYELQMSIYFHSAMDLAFQLHGLSSEIVLRPLKIDCLFGASTPHAWLVTRGISLKYQVSVA